MPLPISPFLLALGGHTRVTFVTPVNQCRHNELKPSFPKRLLRAVHSVVFPNEPCHIFTIGLIKTNFAALKPLHALSIRPFSLSPTPGKC